MNFNNQKDKNIIKKPRTPEIKNINNKNNKGFIKDNINKYKNAYCLEFIRAILIKIY